MSTVTHDIAAKLWNLVEVWSAGKFPHGITPESLKHAHLSVQRNPIIADVFHRADSRPDQPRSCSSLVLSETERQG